MGIVECRAGAHAVAQWIDEQVNETAVPNTLRARLAGACFAVAQEHQAGILLLLSAPHPVHASAFALVRVQYEAVVRGLWLQHEECATDDAVKAFGNNVEPPKVPALLNAIKATEEYQTGLLSHVYARSWKDMCSYAHTGMHQVSRWNSSDAIESNYRESEVIEILIFTGSMALMSVLGLANLSGNLALATAVQERTKQWATENSAIRARL